MGFKISITGGTTRVVFVSVRKAFQQLKETGLVSPELMGEASDHEEMLKMLGLPQIYEMEKKYTVLPRSPSSRAVVAWRPNRFSWNRRAPSRS